MSKFDQLAAKLAAKGVQNPGGLAYSIGKRKYSASIMAKAAARGVPAKSIAQRKGA